eukprot:768578-Hanusia_phi.AAC.2
MRPGVANRGRNGMVGGRRRGMKEGENAGNMFNTTAARSQQHNRFRTLLQGSHPSLKRTSNSTETGSRFSTMIALRSSSWNWNKQVLLCGKSLICTSQRGCWQDEG